MKRITEINFLDSLGGRTPAMVNRITGKMYIDRNWWNTLPFEHRYFILLHEQGHAELNTSNEYEADAYAFREYAKRGYSLTQAVHALTRVLSYDGRNKQEHINRTLALIELAKEYDYKHNGNRKINNFANQFWQI